MPDIAAQRPAQDKDNITRLWMAADARAAVTTNLVMQDTAPGVVALCRLASCQQSPARAVSHAGGSSHALLRLLVVWWGLHSGTLATDNRSSMPDIAAQRPAQDKDNITRLWMAADARAAVTTNLVMQDTAPGVVALRRLASCQQTAQSCSTLGLLVIAQR
jgi:hypothetical protein